MVLLFSFLMIIEDASPFLRDLVGHNRPIIAEDSTVPEFNFDLTPEPTITVSPAYSSLLLLPQFPDDDGDDDGGDDDEDDGDDDDDGDDAFNFNPRPVESPEFSQVLDDEPPVSPAYSPVESPEFSQVLDDEPPVSPA